MKISIIAAVAQNNVIGVKNKLPWYLPADLKRFKKITTGHTVIAGRKTFESIGHPLPDRTNIIVTRNKDYQAKGVKIVYSLNEALRIAREKGEKEAFVIGGGEIFREALPKADKIYLTKVKAKIKGNVFFPKLEVNDWKITSQKLFPPNEKNPYLCEFLTLERKVQKNKI